MDTPTTHADCPLHHAICELNKVKNEVEFDLITGSAPSLERDVISGKIHAAIGAFTQSTGTLEVHPLFYEPHDPYCGFGHPLFGATKAEIREADFSQYMTVQRPYQRGFDVTRFGALRQGGSVNKMVGRLTMLLSGGYIGFLPRHFADSWVEKGKLVALDQGTMTFMSEHSVITKKVSRGTVVLDSFIKALKKVVMLHRRDETA